MKKINLIMIIIGLAGMIILSMIAIIDSMAEDMTSAVVVQLFFASLFISGYISYNKNQ